MTTEALIAIVAIVSTVAGVAAGATVAWSRTSTRLDSVVDRLDTITKASSSRFETMSKQADAAARQQGRTGTKIAILTTRLDGLAKLIRDTVLRRGASASEPDRSGPDVPAAP